MPTCTWMKMPGEPIRPRSDVVLSQFQLECDKSIFHWKPRNWHYCPLCGNTIIEATQT